MTSLIPTQNEAEETAVNDLIKKLMSKVVEVVERETLLYSLILSGVQPLRITSVVAIGLLGGVLSHKKCDDKLQLEILQALMEALKDAEQRHRG